MESGLLGRVVNVSPPHREDVRREVGEGSKETVPASLMGVEEIWVDSAKLGTDERSIEDVPDRGGDRKTVNGEVVSERAF